MLLLTMIKRKHEPAHEPKLRECKLWHPVLVSLLIGAVIAIPLLLFLLNVMIKSFTGHSDMAGLGIMYVLGLAAISLFAYALSAGLVIAYTGSRKVLTLVLAVASGVAGTVFSVLLGQMMFSVFVEQDYTFLSFMLFVVVLVVIAAASAVLYSRFHKQALMHIFSYAAVFILASSMAFAAVQINCVNPGRHVSCAVFWTDTDYCGNNYGCLHDYALKVSVRDNDIAVCRLSFDGSAFADSKFMSCIDGYFKYTHGKSSLLDCNRFSDCKLKKSCFFTNTRYVSPPLRDSEMCAYVRKDCPGVESDISYVLACDLNLQACDRLAGQDSQTCYTAYSKKTHDPSLCENLSPLAKDECNLGHALDQQDFAMCEKLAKSYNRDFCILTIARETNSTDLSVCDRINDANDKNGCFRSVGIARKDPAVCELIKDSDAAAAIKESCLEGIAG
jgi:hypothetical protein